MGNIVGLEICIGKGVLVEMCVKRYREGLEGSRIRMCPMLFIFL